MKIALTREVSPAFARCELTHLAREPIDARLAAEQHRAYEARLEQLGCSVRRLPASAELPDSVFVEDVALVLDEVAVLTRPGAAARRPEVDAVAQALQPFRECRRIEAPATLDGGDVLHVGRTLYVGRSSRSNPFGVSALRDLLAPLGYGVVAVPVRDCLHLKSAVTRIGPRTLLLQPERVDPAAFRDVEIVETDPREPDAANALWIDDAVIYPAGFPRTRQRIEDRGVRVLPVEVSEIAKAEGGVTCCSVLFEAESS
jgi:dimethylargininase